MSNQSNTSNNKLRTVQDITHAIKAKLVDGTYIFRGEPECHKKISSNLFRELEAVQMPYSDIKDVQAEIVAEAKAYTNKKDDFEILTDIQHYEGKTNLIDFTTDYNIALFFACYGSPAKCGRVIILQKTEEIKKMLRYPQTPEIRVCAQKSIFVEPPTGYIEQEYEVICIPKNLKLLILQHLREVHEISLKIIYNDIHGFIRSQKDNWLAYRDFDNGLDSQNKAYKATDLKEKQEACEQAIKDYTNALDRNLELFPVYNNRGIAYGAQGDFDRAIEDFNRTIELEPDYADVYTNRGGTYREKGEVDRAIEDHTKAIDLNPDFAKAYYNRGNAHREQGDFDSAIEDHTKAIELDCHYAEAYSNRGNAYRDKGEVDKAVKDYNKAIELDCHYAEAYYNRGNAYGDKGEVDKVIEDYTKATKIKPDYLEAHYDCGVTYHEQGDFDRAIEGYNKAIELKT